MVKKYTLQSQTSQLSVLIICRWDLKGRIPSQEGVLKNESCDYWSRDVWAAQVSWICPCLMWQSSPRKPCGLVGALAWAVIRAERKTHCLARGRPSCDAGDLGCSMFSSAALFFACWELEVLGKHLVVDSCLHWGTHMYMNCVEEIAKGCVLGFILIFFFFLQSGIHLGDHKWSCLYPATGEHLSGKEPSLSSQLSDSPWKCICPCSWEWEWGHVQTMPGRGGVWRGCSSAPSANGQCAPFSSHSSTAPATVRGEPNLVVVEPPSWGAWVAWTPEIFISLAAAAIFIQPSRSRLVICLQCEGEYPQTFPPSAVCVL